MLCVGLCGCHGDARSFQSLQGDDMSEGDDLMTMGLKIVGALILAVVFALIPLIAYLLR